MQAFRGSHVAWRGVELLVDRLLALVNARCWYSLFFGFRSVMRIGAHAFCIFAPSASPPLIGDPHRPEIVRGFGILTPMVLAYKDRKIAFLVIVCRCCLSFAISSFVYLPACLPGICIIHIVVVVVHQRNPCHRRSRL